MGETLRRSAAEGGGNHRAAKHAAGERLQAPGHSTMAPNATAGPQPGLASIRT